MYRQLIRWRWPRLRHTVVGIAENSLLGFRHDLTEFPVPRFLPALRPLRPTALVAEGGIIDQEGAAVEAVHGTPQALTVGVGEVSRVTANPFFRSGFGRSPHRRHASLSVLKYVTSNPLHARYRCMRFERSNVSFIS